MARRILLSLLTLVVLFAATMWLSWSKGAPSYAPSRTMRSSTLPLRMRSGEEHDAIVKRTWPAPYVFEAKNLVFFGAHHTSDRHDPQLAAIEREWNALKPTVALNEGRRRGYFLGPFRHFGAKGESQLVHELALRDGVPLYSLEPEYEEEVAGLLEKWSPEQVALYFTMRVYWSEAGGKADDDLALHLLEKRTNVNGLRGSLKSVADIDRVWKREFPQLGDWRTLTSEPRDTWLAAMSLDSRRIRGEHMARTILDLHKRGERVFAVAGSGHVIRLEWILRSSLGLPPAGDQPLA